MHVSLIVSGRVQMVRFRVFVVKWAQYYDVWGTVQNSLDGTVKIEAWGTKESLQLLIQKVHQGSPLSRVDNVAEVWDNKEYSNSETPVFKLIH